MPNKVGRRRAPHPPSGYARMLQRISDNLSKAGKEEEESKKTTILSSAQRDMSQLGRMLEREFNRLGDSIYLGLPAPHTHEDDDTGGMLDQAELVAWLAFQRADEHVR